LFARLDACLCRCRLLLGDVAAVPSRAQVLRRRVAPGHRHAKSRHRLVKPRRRPVKPRRRRGDIRLVHENNNVVDDLAWIRLPLRGKFEHVIDPSSRQRGCALRGLAT
jgi:hypothetical protein